MVSDILAKKQRLKMAIELMPSSRDYYYDLFCDHGFLGIALKEKWPEAHVIWNDSNDILLRKLQETQSISNECIEAGNAQDLWLKENAGIYLLGVGGHLMVKCLESWFERGHVHSSQTFVFSPTYYQLNLRECLENFKGTLLKRAFVWERGVGHELFLVEFRGGASAKNSSFQWSQFDESFWKTTLESTPEALLYLQKKAHSLEKNRSLPLWQQSYASGVSHFLKGVQSNLR